MYQKYVKCLVLQGSGKILRWYYLLLTVGSTVETVAWQDAKPPFAKGTEGSRLPGKNNTQLTHSSYFIQTYTRLIGTRRSSNYQSPLSLAVNERRQPAQISVPLDMASHNQKYQVCQECLKTKI